MSFRHIACLAALLPSLLLIAGTAMAAECQMPELQSASPPRAAGTIDNDRAALLRYEQCLREEQNLLEALQAGSPERAARQREAAANLRRTLDAWQQTLRAADARPKGS